jgi:hypothetical protein
VWSFISSLKHGDTTPPSGLFMVLVAGRWSDEIPHGCHIFLLQPLSASTVLDIVAKTPVVHDDYDHFDCNRSRTGRQNGYCVRESAKAHVRPVERLRSLSITRCGWLITEHDYGKPENGWTTQLKFQNTCVRDLGGSHSSSEPTRYFDTIMELEKILAYRRHQDTSKESLVIDPGCRLADRYRDFNLVVMLDTKTGDKFIDKVCSIS